MVMDILDFLAIWTPIGYILLVNLFKAAMSAKEDIRNGVQYHWSFYYPLLIGAGVGLLLDIVVMNFLIGTIAFRRLPNLLHLELTFTSRVQNIVDRGPSHPWYERAVWWGIQLNKIDARHIRGLPNSA
jgi:hypothetical protein